jgi:hypothetical protein
MARAVTADAEAREQPIYWFARLETALNRGDYEEAATAQRELKRLGVEVRIRRQRGMKRA